MEALRSWWSGSDGPVEHEPADVLTWSTGDVRYAIQSGDTTLLREKWNEADESAFLLRAATAARHVTCSKDARGEEDAFRCCARNTLDPLKGGLILFCGSLIDTHVERHQAVQLGVRTLLNAASFCFPSSLLVLRLPLCRVVMTYEGDDCKRQASTVSAAQTSSRWLPRLIQPSDKVQSAASQQQPLDDARRREIVTGSSLVLLRLLLADGAVDGSILDVLKTIDNGLADLFASSAANGSSAPLLRDALWRALVVHTLQSMVVWICRGVAQCMACGYSESDADALGLAVLLWLRCIRVIGPSMDPVHIPAVAALCKNIIDGDPAHPASAWPAKQCALEFLMTAFCAGFIAPTDSVAVTINGVVFQWAREKPFLSCSFLAMELVAVMVDSSISAVRSLGPLMELVDFMLQIGLSPEENRLCWNWSARLEVCRIAAKVVRSWSALELRLLNAPASGGESKQIVGSWVRQTASRTLDLLIDLAVCRNPDGDASANSSSSDKGACLNAWVSTLDALVASCRDPYLLREISSSLPLALTELGEEWMLKFEACALNSAFACGDVVLRLHRLPFAVYNSGTLARAADLGASRLWTVSLAGKRRFDALLLALARFAVDGLADASAADGVVRAVVALADVAGRGLLPAAFLPDLALFGLDELLGTRSGGRYDSCALRLLSLTDPSFDKTIAGGGTFVLPMQSLTATQLKAAAACLRRHQGWVYNDGEVLVLQKVFGSWKPSLTLIPFDVKIIASLSPHERRGLLHFRKWMVRKLHQLPISFFRAVVELAFPSFVGLSPVAGDALLAAIARHLS